MAQPNQMQKNKSRTEEENLKSKDSDSKQDTADATTEPNSISKKQTSETSDDTKKVVQADSKDKDSDSKRSSKDGKIEQASAGDDKDFQSIDKKEGVRADKGTGYFPLSDMQFDVVKLIYKKSKALKAYDQYLLDCLPCTELRDVIEDIAADDRKHIEQLKRYLGKDIQT